MGLISLKIFLRIEMKFFIKVLSEYDGFLG
jgi:hypothetical protein